MLGKYLVDSEIRKFIIVVFPALELPLINVCPFPLAKKSKKYGVPIDVLNKVKNAPHFPLSLPAVKLCNDANSAKLELKTIFSLRIKEKFPGSCE